MPSFDLDKKNSRNEGRLIRWETLKARRVKADYAWIEP